MILVCLFLSVLASLVSGQCLTDPTFQLPTAQNVFTYAVGSRVARDVNGLELGTTETDSVTLRRFVVNSTHIKEEFQFRQAGCTNVLDFDLFTDSFNNGVSFVSYQINGGAVISGTNNGKCYGGLTVKAWPSCTGNVVISGDIYFFEKTYCQSYVEAIVTILESGVLRTNIYRLQVVDQTAWTNFQC